MSKKNKLKTRKAAHNCDVQREQAEKKKREVKAAKVKAKTEDAVKKVAAKSQKGAIKRRRRDLLRKGIKYEDILKEEEQILSKEMELDD